MGKITVDSRSMRQRMEDGDYYIADDPELKELRLVGHDIAAAYNQTTPRQVTLRKHLLQLLLGSIGDETEIRPPFYVDYGSNVSFGARCFANRGLMALDVAKIKIGDDVKLGPNVQILTPTHPIEADLRLQRWESAAPITIGDNVWIGGGAIVCPGVTIGANSVVGAGAVVSSDLPPNVVAWGDPARVYRRL